MDTRPAAFWALRTRYAALAWFAGVFLAVECLTRLALLLKTGSGVPVAPLYWLYLFAVGLGYDLVALVYVAWPLVLFLWLVPRRAFPARPARAVLTLLLLAMVYGLLFVTAAEWLFWDEFASRFNFIAVDYLVYSREVIGNIRASYPVGRVLVALGVAASAVLYLARFRWRPREDASRLRQRSAVTLAWLLLTIIVTCAVDGESKNATANEYVNELAGNGVYEFFSAFRNNELDWRRFYRTLPDATAFARTRELLKTPEATFVDADPRDITREIRNAGPEQHLNVILVSVESLSADYLGAFGGSKHLTPNLDALAAKSLLFTRLYASGTRTVRGLEALSLSVPPTPGQSIVKRPDNENLFSLGSVFDEKGYDSMFVYGGYGYFDNMNYFFSHNGYRTVDRSDIPSDQVHAANIWGVADEDLFTLALREADHAAAANRPFFEHVMTTSNHPPFTYPVGRIDLPSGKAGRAGAVKYTDWALGDFLARAAGKPWFDDTVFVITADHCSSSWGRSAIPMNRYHIPLLIYSPKHIAPARVDRLMAQIDIPPTLLGLLDFSYTSKFYGYDLFKLEPGRERALLGNYQKAGYLRDDVLTVLAPRKHATQTLPKFDNSGDAAPLDAPRPQLVDDAIAYYQTASERFNEGLMRIAVPPAARITKAAPR
ncbi:MAG: LTA synthase family protein [Dokdonella sp.]|uniref:LTA synthase family protein n=1 Tax=Dokdonella sp. TaxID=2291710 RepID=UPI003F7FCFB7